MTGNMSDILAVLAQQAPAAPSQALGIALYALIFAFVFLLVLAVFGQRGQAEITPERQVAVATGHADRQTVFETTALQPLMWLFLALAKRIKAVKFKRWLRTTLVAAGSPNFYTAEEYMALSMLWALITCMLVQVANMMVSSGISLALAPVGLLVGCGGYIYHAYGLAQKRIRLIGKRIPYTLDLIALAMGAGATFTEAVRTVIREDPKHPFNVELNTVLAEVELGTTRAQALRNLSDRIPLGGLRSIVAAIIQAEGLGTPLSDVLKGQANLLRLQRSVRAEKMAAAASVRILIPSLLILISVVLTVFGPIIVRAVQGTLF